MDVDASSAEFAAAESPPMDDDARAELLRDAQDPETSPFDYIIVGSGAGGGPLAARLALAGKKVLVIEAGTDPAKIVYPPDLATGAEPIVGEVSRVPGYYAAASEDAKMSWMFSVRHHADTEVQARDEKYNRSIDPITGGKVAAKYLDPHPRGGKQGIFYPRSSGIGGCTGHHAMITVRPNDKDWEYIAKLTGDASWRASVMRGYFAKFERNQYIDTYDKALRKFLGLIYRVWRWLVLLFDPRAVLDNGGHGFKGWAPTNLIDPYLVSTIATKDRPFIQAITTAALAVLHGNSALIAMLKHQLLRLRVVAAVDFNDVNTRRATPEGVFLIPLGIEGGRDAKDEGQPGTGRRFGVREFFLNTRFQHPDRLVVEAGVHVTRLLFEEGEAAPRAIGVECAVGEHLYEASPVQRLAAELPKSRTRYFARKDGGEIILCGGAFNTPQLLMLSGIGPVRGAQGGKGHLEKIAADGIHDAPLHKILTEQERTIAAAGELCTMRDRSGNVLRDEHGIAGRVHLPGVGSNLQDRYEVTVVSELNKDFSTLQDVSFLPGDKNDPARRQWLQDRTGLYATNGGTLAVIRRSAAAKAAGDVEPDLFTFGAPAAFRGYYWNWSRELFKETIGASEEKRRLWSWVILKAYTTNHEGTVRLRSGSPFDMPEIYFDAFNEKAESDRPRLEQDFETVVAECDRLASAGIAIPKSLGERRRRAEEALAQNRAKLEYRKRDLAAMVDAVAFMRKVNAKNPEQFVREIQPGAAIKDETPEMEKWVREQAWGHHCSCTCRIGADAWTADTSKLRDKMAVLDSRFRVHGVEGLRIVDASVFPKIPGYFIFAPIFMISEKAADTLLDDSQSHVYPAGIEAAEAKAIRERRRVACIEPTPPAPNADPGRLPERTVGLALSGGGIRSSTFALGVLQALAQRNRLREVDVLSTVSGGGFIGSFLGRLFTRDSVGLACDPSERVQEILKDSCSAPLKWLRTQANYIFATGTPDLRLNLAVLWRNIVTVYLVMGALLLTVFGILAWLPNGLGLIADRLGIFQTRMLLEACMAPPVVRGITLSHWWWLPVVALGLGVLPATFGFWLAPRAGSYRPYPFFAIVAWLILLSASLIAFGIPHAASIAAFLSATLVLAWAWQEMARQGLYRGDETEAERVKIGKMVANRVVRSLGEVLSILFVFAGWVLLDTFARLFAEQAPGAALAAALAALAPLMPFLQKIATIAKQELSPGTKRRVSLVAVGNLLGIPLAVFLLFVVDVFAHKLFLTFPGWSWGLFIIMVTGAFSIALGRAFEFLNLSSLHATYSSRITRTFQGASNDARVYSSDTTEGHDVGVALPDDDLLWHDYHPEKNGGPLHLVNVCVNETVEAASLRDIRERKGIPMCITPLGVSVGRQYFAEWTKPDSLPSWQKIRRWLAGVDGEDAKPFLPPSGKQPGTPLPPALTALKALPFANDPNAFHVLSTTQSDSAEVESLTVGEWIAVSGAAFSTGIGRETRLPLSLFMGLTNVRLGYWWDSGILYHERPGRYPRSLWRRIKEFPETLLRTQFMLLGEWSGRFFGPSRWFWYLSDGGHFEVTGLYELLRRRVRFIILSDAGEDPNYLWGDVSLLTQLVRHDFRAEIVWVDLKHACNKVPPPEAFVPAGRPNEGDFLPPHPGPEVQRKAEAETEWKRIIEAAKGQLAGLDPWICEWINPRRLGTLNDIHRKGAYHAALARVTYEGSQDLSWILLMKPGLNTELTQDIINYGEVHPDFPQTPTFDQVFDDMQWESYRALGQQIAGSVLR